MDLKRVFKPSFIFDRLHFFSHECILRRTLDFTDFDDQKEESMKENQSPPQHTEEDEMPRGAIAFLAIMFGSYAVYWAILYMVTMIQRGGG
jgi:hypothetical protein